MLIECGANPTGNSAYIGYDFQPEESWFNHDLPYYVCNLKAERQLYYDDDDAVRFYGPHNNDPDDYINTMENYDLFNKYDEQEEDEQEDQSKIRRYHKWCKERAKQEEERAKQEEEARELQEQEQEEAEKEKRREYQSKIRRYHKWCKERAKQEEEARELQEQARKAEKRMKERMARRKRKLHRAQEEKRKEEQEKRKEDYRQAQIKMEAKKKRWRSLTQEQRDAEIAEDDRRIEAIGRRKKKEREAELLIIERKNIINEYQISKSNLQRVKAKWATEKMLGVDKIMNSHHKAKIKYKLIALFEKKLEAKFGKLVAHCIRRKIKRKKELDDCLWGR